MFRKFIQFLELIAVLAGAYVVIFVYLLAFNN